MGIKKIDIIDTIKAYGIDVTDADIKFVDEQTKLGFKDTLIESEAIVWKKVLKDRICLKVNDLIL